MILVIVESPSKCKKIESYLGSGYKCVASFGHICEFKDGLKSIDNSLGSNEYSRLRFGIGGKFIKGNQSNYVLENFSKSELENIEEQIQESLKIIEGFCFEGIEKTMNKFN